ncbi:HAMP domain-containing protein [Spirillospora sp. NPDC127506]
MLLVADALALAAALLLALLTTRGVLRPVRRLAAAAGALGAGELGTRVRVRGRDEPADLARTFNRTAAVLERTVTELRAMEAASRRFVADVSHELRTPLTSMIAMTGVLAEEEADRPDGGAARLIAAETRRLGRLRTIALAVPGLRFAGGRVVLGRGWSRTELAQLVCTAEAMPGVSTVQVSSWSGEGEAHTMRCDRFSDLLE